MTRRAAKGDGDAGPSVTLRSQHAEATRRAVLDAARSLFGRKGYAQASVDEIADAALVTKGAVYHHFANKEALFRAVYAEVESDAQARALHAADPESPPVDQVVAMMGAYLDAALDLEIRRITLIDGPAIVGHEPDESAARQPAYLAVRAFLTTSMKNGQLIELDPDTLADLVGGLAWVAGLLIARAGDPDATRAALGPVAWQSSGRGPALVLFAGALANHDLWRDVVAALDGRYRCVTVDLPLGAHPTALTAGADRSAASLARLLLDSLDLLDVTDATVVANDTAGGLLLLSLASGHPALGRVGRLVLTNCESYDQFPPDALKKASALSRAFPWLARTAIRLQLRQQLRRPGVQSKGIDFPHATLVSVPGARTWVPVDNPAAVAGAIAEFVPAQVP